MFKTTPLFTVLGTALLLPALALASPDGHGTSRGHHFDAGPVMQDGDDGWMQERDGMMHGLRGLDLSESQRDRLFEIRHQQAPAMHAQMKDLRQAREALRELGRADRFDEPRARALSRRIADATAALAMLRAQNEQRVRAILTAEQRAQLDQRRDDRQNCRMRDKAERTRFGRHA